MNDDMDDMIDGDVQKVKRSYAKMQREGFHTPSFPTLVANAFLTVGLLGAVVWMALLFFTRELIPGRLWMFGGIGFMVLFLGTGAVLKWLNTQL